MASEPVNSGEKVTVAGEEGVVVRGVKIRGGYEYTVRVADENSAANETLKLPQGFNPVAAFGTPEEAELNEENRRKDDEERQELEDAIREERQEYADRETELGDKLREANKDDDRFDAGTVSHLVAAQATAEVDAERAERAGSKVDGRRKADQGSTSEKLRDTSTTGKVDEHGSNLANQDDREKAAPGSAGAGKTTDAKAATEGKRNR